jgi:hypothetical protein
MLWVLTIPVIWYLTFREMIISGFPDPESSHRGFLSWVFCLFVSAFISVLISLVPLGIAAFIGSLPKRHGIESHRFELVALREKDGVNGRFFLATGSLESTEYYFWYRKDKDGSIRGGKTRRASGVRIWQDAQTPCMVEFETKYERKHVEQWLWIVGLDMRDGEDWCPAFHIPPNSIKEGYQL